MHHEIRRDKTGRIRIMDRWKSPEPASWVACIHEKVWPEGDLFEDLGGRACRECVEATNEPGRT